MSGKFFSRRPYGSIFCMIFIASLASQLCASAAKTTGNKKTASKKIESKKIHELSNIEIVEKLRAANRVDPTYNLTVAKSPDEILITTKQSPKATQEAMKVQAVLIAKTTFDVVPKDMERTKIVFQQDGNMCSEISINRTEIGSYARGELTIEKLLKSLDLETREDDSKKPAVVELKVVAGPCEAERFAQLASIRVLESRGVDLTEAEVLFAQVEKSATAGDKKAVLAGLKRVAALEKAKKAEQAAAGKATAGPVEDGHKSAPAKLEEDQIEQNSKKLLILVHQLLDDMTAKGANVEVERKEVAEAELTGPKRGFWFNLRKRLLLKFLALPPATQEEFKRRYPTVNLVPDKPPVKSPVESKASRSKAADSGGAEASLPKPGDSSGQSRRLPYQIEKN